MSELQKSAKQLAEERLLSGLNPEQRSAVTHASGPLMIVAGAGTGKTTVITRRIAWLIATEKATADQILALTFTDKAAGEMEERVDVLLPYGYTDLWISTFHAFCERILREHAIDIGLPNDFKLVNDIEAQLLMRKYIAEFDLKYYRPIGNPTKFLGNLVRHFSRAKDEDISPQQYAEYAQNQVLNTDQAERTKNKNADGTQVEEFSEAERLVEIAKAYATYERVLRENHALDFGDLITQTMRLFRERPFIRKKYQEQFRFMLVDEFQDTNTAQYDLLKLLVSDAQNITVVGDDDQSIYRFRGASISNILTFKKDFPHSKDIVLVQNYRSPQEILDLAYRFIQLNNPDRLEAQMNGGSPFDHPISKQLKSNVEKPSDIRHLHVATMEDEGVITAKEILSLVGNSGSTATSTASANEPLSYRDIAILVRANDHTETFIAALERFEIPYHVVSSKGLLFRSEIVDLLSYARLLDNYHEARAVWRVLNFPQWQIPPRDQSILMQTITRKGISAFDAILNARTISGLSENTLFVCNRIASLVERHATRAARTKPSQLFLSILQDTGYFEYLSHRSQTEEAAVREILENFEALLKMATHFERATPNATLKNFLQEIDLMMASGESGDLPATSQESPDAVSVMTAHAAKGLEFAYVFIGNLVDKRFPSVGRNDAIELPEVLLKEILPTGDFHLQEERRLFYVACTRAKRGLVFVSAEDYGGLRKKKLSRFLVEAGLAATARKVPMPTGSVALPELGSKLPENLTSQHTPTLGKDSLPLPRTLSFTQMKAFETCPYQYRFAHLLKIPVPGRPTFSFGKTIHATLQEFFKRIQIKRKHPQTNLFGETNADASDAAPTLEELLEIYDSVFIDDWYDSPSQKQEYKERGRELLKIFYESHNGVFPNPKYLEKGFLVRVGEYGVRGFLDRADSVDGGLEIIDYKTGKPPASEHYLEKDQLNLYAIAANEVFHEKPARLTFWYLEGNKKYSFEPDESQIEKLREKISAIAKKIATSDFKATPGRHCRTCDFRDICEFRAK